MLQVERKRMGFESQGRDRVGRVATSPRHAGCCPDVWTGLSAGRWLWKGTVSPSDATAGAEWQER